MPKYPRISFLGYFFDLNICMEIQLSVADIANVKSLLEAACSRGAYRANEMSQVGLVYDKISLFLDQTAAQLQQQQTTTPKGDSNA